MQTIEYISDIPLLHLVVRSCMSIHFSPINTYKYRFNVNDKNYFVHHLYLL